MKLLDVPIINFFRWQGILLKSVRNVKAFVFLSERERHRNIYVTPLGMNLMIRKLKLFKKHLNNKKTSVNITLILINKILAKK
jgi:hypothetical protein